MEGEGLLRDARLRVGALVCVCFALGPAGYFAWFYNAAALADAATVDFYTLVLAYFVQAAGVGAYMAARRSLGKRAVLGTVAASLVLFVATLEPAALSDDVVAVLACGLVMNLPCGYFQGHYLTCVAELVPPDWRGRVFGGGYAAATVVSWLLASYGGGVLTQGVPGLAACVLLVLAAGACLYATALLEAPADPAPTIDAPSLRTLVIVAGAAVIACSLVKNTGFRSLAGEFAGGSIEMSRVFYGVGLLIAGVAADRDRRLALACCAASLAVPFLQLALEGFEVSGFVLWSLGYLLQGFFVVWRVVLFADIVDASGRMWLAGAGLVFGRLGDALGTWLTQALTPWPVALVASAFALFALSYFLLLRLWGRMYGAAAGDDADAVCDEYDPLVEFCGEHGLSMREREVLYFVLAGRTNAETAHELGVTEGTVKFHMTNILKKTGCANRNGVAKLYNRSLKGR